MSDTWKRDDNTAMWSEDDYKYKMFNCKSRKGFPGPEITVSIQFSHPRSLGQRLCRDSRHEPCRSCPSCPRPDLQGDVRRPVGSPPARQSTASWACPRGGFRTARTAPSSQRGARPAVWASWSRRIMLVSEPRGAFARCNVLAICNGYSFFTLFCVSRTERLRPAFRVVYCGV